MVAKAKRSTSSTKKTAPKRSTARRSKTSGAKISRAKPSSRRWSRQVTEHSDALDLKKGVFTLSDPKKIAVSLKRSAEKSRRRKSDPYRSAMSMITFYVNRGGHNLSARRKAVLDRAKDELRKQFGRA